MEKLISVINDNIRSIISGIKINAADIEKNLKNVIGQMEEMVKVANNYKEDVENSKKSIEALESEITRLENDLDDLQAKFGSRDFNELLAAGNKEISTKIIEKRATISKISEHIIDITDQAHQLKEDLLRLKEQKTSFEISLNNANTVKKYYETRLTEVIDYAEDHATDLDKFVEEKPSEQLLSDTQLDVEEIQGNVDGSVFEEIDEISSSAPSKDMIEEVIKSTKVDIPEEDIDISMTQKLDDIILTANELLSETEDLRTDIPSVSAYVREEEEDEVIKKDIYTQGPSPISDLLDDEENSNDSDDSLLGFNLNDLKQEANMIDENDESEGFSLENLFNKEENQDTTKPIDLPGLDIDLSDIGAKEVDPETFYTSEIKKPVLETTELTNTMNRYAVNPQKFNEDELKLLEEKLTPMMFEEYMNVLGKHSIGPNVIYSGVNVLVNVESQTVDKIITILESVGANSQDIELTFKWFDMVDLDKLENVSRKNPDAEISKILYNSMESIKTNEEIANILELNGVENQILKNSSSSDEYNRMCIFSDLVKKNYDTLDSYDIDITKECFVKHPHRFLLNPSEFSDILDKYDPEDLVRCINKNIAVIDKL